MTESRWFMASCKRAPYVILLLLLCTVPLVAQQLGALIVTDKTPRFDIASVKRNLNPDGPRAFSAQGTREQLGLRLEPSRAPVEVLVIETVTMPTAD